MGSDSDLPTMKAAEDILHEFGVPCELTIVSAHRTPDRMMTYARTAHERGLQVRMRLAFGSVLVARLQQEHVFSAGLSADCNCATMWLARCRHMPGWFGSCADSALCPPLCVCLQVIIAGAGGAAHLPGMVAAMTPLPVVGVPVKPAGAYLDGVDALLSICQMPKGVPVATVAIGNAANAGLLAVRILAGTDAALLQKMLDYQDGMRDMVLSKAAKVEAERA